MNMEEDQVYYRFLIKKDIEKLSKYANIFFVLCALQPDGKLDFLNYL